MSYHFLSSAAFKKEFTKLGGSFVALARSFDHDKRPDSQALTAAIEHTGRTYEQIGKLHEEQVRTGAEMGTASYMTVILIVRNGSQFYQWTLSILYSLWFYFSSFQPKHDMIHLMEGLQEYKGILSTFPDVLSVYKVRKIIVNINNIISNWIFTWADFQMVQSRYSSQFSLFYFDLKFRDPHPASVCLFIMVCVFVFLGRIEQNPGARGWTARGGDHAGSGPRQRYRVRHAGRDEPLQPVPLRRLQALHTAIPTGTDSVL